MKHPNASDEELDVLTPNIPLAVVPASRNTTSARHPLPGTTPVSICCVPVLSKYRMRVALAGIGYIYATLQTLARNVRAVQSSRTEM